MERGSVWGGGGRVSLFRRNKVSAELQASSRFLFRPGPTLIPVQPEVPPPASTVSNVGGTISGGQRVNKKEITNTPMGGVSNR